MNKAGPEETMPLQQTTPSPKRPWMPPRQRTFDYLSSPIEPDQDRDLIDATDSEGEENDGDSDMLDLDDFGPESWTPFQTPILGREVSTGENSDATREINAAETGAEGRADNEMEEDEDKGLVFEERDAFSSTKTSSDYFARYSESLSIPPTPSMNPTTGDDVGLGLSLTVNAPESDGSQSKEETDIAANESFEDQLLKVPGTKTSSRPRQGTVGSGGSGSTVRPSSVVFNPFGAVVTLDPLSEERRNDFLVPGEAAEGFAAAQARYSDTSQPFSLSIGDIAQLLDRGIGPSNGGFQDQKQDEDDEVTTGHVENISIVSTYTSSHGGIRAIGSQYLEEEEMMVSHAKDTINPSTARNIRTRLRTSRHIDEDDEATDSHVEHATGPTKTTDIGHQVLGVGISMSVSQPTTEGKAEPDLKSGEESPSSDEDWAEAVAKPGQSAEDTLMDELQDMLESTSTVAHIAMETEEEENITAILKSKDTPMESSLSTVSTLLGVSDKKDEDSNDITAVFSPQNPPDKIEAQSVRTTKTADASHEDMEDAPPPQGQHQVAKPEILGGDPRSATFGHKLSTISRTPFSTIPEMVKDTRTGSWISLSDNLTRAQKKGIVLTIFLHHTTTLFASTLHVDYSNVFTSTSPIPHMVWAKLFTADEGMRLFEAQNGELYASALTKTKSVLEEWRLSYGFPRVPEAYMVDDKLVSYTRRGSCTLELQITRDLLETRNKKTERWLKSIFKLGREVIIDGLMYGGMIDGMVRLVGKIYSSPTGLREEHKRTVGAKKALRMVVVDELGILLEGLRLV